MNNIDSLSQSFQQSFKKQSSKTESSTLAFVNSSQQYFQLPEVFNNFTNILDTALFCSNDDQQMKELSEPLLFAKQNSEEQDKLSGYQYFQGYRDLIFKYNNLNPIKMQQLLEQKYDVTPKTLEDEGILIISDYKQYEKELSDVYRLFPFYYYNDLERIDYRLCISRFQVPISVRIIPFNIPSRMNSNKIERGAFGQIYRYLKKLKQYCFKKIIRRQQRTFIQALQVEEALKQVGVCKLLGLFKIGPKFEQIQQGVDVLVFKDCVCFIMELCIPLEERLYQLKNQSQDHALKNFQQSLLENLAILHSMKIVHRDIKLGNIVYSERTNKFVLIDFGLTQSVSANCFQKTQLKILGGTPNYLHPQMKNMFTSQNAINRPFYFCLQYSDYYAFRVTMSQIHKIPSIDNNFFRDRFQTSILILNQCKNSSLTKDKTLNFCSLIIPMHIHYQKIIQSNKNKIRYNQKPKIKNKIVQEPKEQCACPIKIEQDMIKTNSKCSTNSRIEQDRTKQIYFLTLKNNVFNQLINKRELIIYYRYIQQLEMTQFQQGLNSTISHHQKLQYFIRNNRLNSSEQNSKFLFRSIDFGLHVKKMQVKYSHLLEFNLLQNFELQIKRQINQLLKIITCSNKYFDVKYYVFLKKFLIESNDSLQFLEEFKNMIDQFSKGSSQIRLIKICDQMIFLRFFNQNTIFYIQYALEVRKRFHRYQDQSTATLLLNCCLIFLQTHKTNRRHIQKLISFANQILLKLKINFNYSRIALKFQFIKILNTSVFQNQQQTLQSILKIKRNINKYFSPKSYFPLSLLITEMYLKRKNRQEFKSLVQQFIDNVLIFNYFTVKNSMKGELKTSIDEPFYDFFPQTMRNKSQSLKINSRILNLIQKLEQIKDTQLVKSISQKQQQLYRAKDLYLNSIMESDLMNFIQRSSRFQNEIDKESKQLINNFLIFEKLCSFVNYIDPHIKLMIDITKIRILFSVIIHQSDQNIDIQQIKINKITSIYDITLLQRSIKIKNMSINLNLKPSIIKMIFKQIIKKYQIKCKSSMQQKQQLKQFDLYQILTQNISKTMPQLMCKYEHPCPYQMVDQCCYLHHDQLNQVMKKIQKNYKQLVRERQNQRKKQKMIIKQLINNQKQHQINRQNQEFSSDEKITQKIRKSINCRYGETCKYFLMHQCRYCHNEE